MSDRQPSRPSPSRPSPSRPLPPRPNLEFERKHAKKLLKHLHDGDADALIRATNIARAPFQLSDAQLIIAREYGFANWPQLVAYFEQWERHYAGGPLTLHPLEYFESQVNSILEHQAKGSTRWTAHLATFLPRFYALSDEEIVGATVSREEAQHVVTRMIRLGSWDELIAAAPVRPKLTQAEREAMMHPDPTTPGMRL